MEGYFQTGSKVVEIQQIGDLVKSKVYLTQSFDNLSLDIQEQLEVGGGVGYHRQTLTQPRLAGVFRGGV